MDHAGIDFSLESAACKVFASDLAFRAACDAQQIAGGLGYSSEYPYEQAVHDSRIMLIFEGTNEILRALIALSGLQQPGERLKALGKAFSDPLSALGAVGTYLGGRVKRQLAKPEFAAVHPALRAETDESGEGHPCVGAHGGEAAGRAWPECRRAPVPSGASGQRGHRHLSVHGHAFTRHMGTR